MKVCIIHGSPRKGNTFKAAEIVKENLAGYGDYEFTEFFLPRDLPHFCNGCFVCFLQGEAKCPHAAAVQPIAKAIREADGLIITTPVYSLAESAGVKALLDHLSYNFMNHRPMAEIFSKVALVLTTTVGYGNGYAIKPIARALRFWGIRRVLKCGLTLFAIDWDQLPQRKQERIRKQLAKKAWELQRLLAKRERLRVSLFTRGYFRLCRRIMLSMADGAVDKEYWRGQGWLEGKRRPF